MPFNPPEGLTEEYCVEIIQQVADTLCHRFTFPGFDADEARGQAMLFAVEGLKRFDPSRKLPNFLFRHVRNRLLNYIRDRWQRSESPCKRCQSGYPCDPDGQECSRHLAWKELQARKRITRNFLPLDKLDDALEERARVAANAESDAEVAEITRMIDRDLSVAHRQIMLQMRAGVAVPRAQRLEVQREVERILVEAGLAVDGVVEDVDLESDVEQKSDGTLPSFEQTTGQHRRVVTERETFRVVEAKVA